ncbi:hypothetical protein [Nonomuraea sp. NPDC049504]|uniref:hypothetical protein n=1 Tax=Nonomuraea sp. NPDC049504 TaxID=3154729 RepID=UPI00343B4BDD
MSHRSVQLSTDISTNPTMNGPAAHHAVLGRARTTRPAPAALPGIGLDECPRPSGSLPLDMAEHAFGLLMHGPTPLSVDGERLGHGLPARTIPLNELKEVLLHPSCSRTTRDHVWRHLINQARTLRKAWMVAAVALAIPMLRRLVTALADKTPAEQLDREDLEAEVLMAYLEALYEVNLAWSHPLLRLSRLTHLAVLRAHAAGQPSLLADPDLTDRADSGMQTLAYPAGHPDQLLDQAVAQGIITEAEAELIVYTRLEGIPLSAYCRRRGLLYCTAIKRRQRAETALHQALQRGDL